MSQNQSSDNFIAGKCLSPAHSISENTEYGASTSTILCTEVSFYGPSNWEHRGIISSCHHYTYQMLFGMTIDPSDGTRVIYTLTGRVQA